MLRRAFRAMGTDVELLLDAEAGERAERALDRAEAEFERLEQVMSRFRDRLRAVAPQPRRPDRGGEPRSRPCRRARARRPRAHRRAVRSDRPRCRRRRRLRPDLRRRSRRTPRGLHLRHDALRRRRARRRAHDRARRRHPPRSRRHRQGLRRRPRRRPARASPAHASSTPAATSPSAAGPGRSVSPTSLTLELSRGAIATSGRDRRHWRVAGTEHAPPDRPLDGPAGRAATSSRSPSSPTPPPTPRCSPRRSFLGAVVDVPHVLVTADGRTVLAGGLSMRHDPTFWLLARASGLTAYVLLTLSVLAGLVLKSRPFRALKPAVSHRPAPHPRDARARRARRPRRRARARHDRSRQHRRTVRPRPRLLPADLDVLRHPRRGADGARLRIVLAAQAHRHEELAPPALGHVRPLRPRDRARPRRRHRLEPPLGVRLYVAAVAAVAAATTWRFLVPPARARARRPVTRARATPNRPRAGRMSTRRSARQRSQARSASASAA